MVVADLDMSLITKRKRMMDSVGHYARPELLSLRINSQPAQTAVPMHPALELPHDDPRTNDAEPGHAAADDGAAVLRVAAG